ncbi:hypothetical protein DXC29_04835 [Bifidobacterium pseudocatenulatum]|nr:hypothetical protein DXC29_04835 [Bifidobacterium pseudocatenulatum]
MTSAKKQEYETRKSQNIGRKDIVSKRVESTGVASQCNDYIGNPIAHDIQQKKSDERGAASFYNLARVGVGEDRFDPRLIMNTDGPRMYRYRNTRPTS